MSLDCTICEDYQTTGVTLGCPPNLRYYQKFLDQGPYSCCDQVLNPDETNIPDILSPELCYEQCILKGPKVCFDFGWKSGSNQCQLYPRECLTYNQLCDLQLIFSLTKEAYINSFGHKTHEWQIMKQLIFDSKVCQDQELESLSTDCPYSFECIKDSEGRSWMKMAGVNIIGNNWGSGSSGSDVIACADSCVGDCQSFSFDSSSQCVGKDQDSKSAPNIETYRLDIDLYERVPLFCGWRLVRQVPLGNTWHQATDKLLGTSVYGKPYDRMAEWSIGFGTFDQIMISSGDYSVWAVMEKTQALISDPIFLSSYLTDSTHQQSTGDTNVIMIGNLKIYQENSAPFAQNNGGNKVYVRDSTVSPNIKACLKPQKDEPIHVIAFDSTGDYRSWSEHQSLESFFSGRLYTTSEVQQLVAEKAGKTSYVNADFDTEPLRSTISTISEDSLEVWTATYLNSGTTTRDFVNIGRLRQDIGWDYWMRSCDFYYGGWYTTRNSASVSCMVYCLEDYPTCKMYGNYGNDCRLYSYNMGSCNTNSYNFYYVSGRYSPGSSHVNYAGDFPLWNSLKWNRAHTILLISYNQCPEARECITRLNKVWIKHPGKKLARFIEILTNQDSIHRCSKYCVESKVIYETIIYNPTSQECQCYDKDVNSIIVDDNGLEDSNSHDLYQLYSVDQKKLWTLENCELRCYRHKNGCKYYAVSNDMTECKLYQTCDTTSNDINYKVYKVQFETDRHTNIPCQTRPSDPQNQCLKSNIQVNCNDHKIKEDVPTTPIQTVEPYNKNGPTHFVMNQLYSDHIYCQPSNYELFDASSEVYITNKQGQWVIVPNDISKEQKYQFKIIITVELQTYSNLFEYTTTDKYTLIVGCTEALVVNSDPNQIKVMTIKTGDRDVFEILPVISENPNCLITKVSIEQVFLNGIRNTTAMIFSKQCQDPHLCFQAVPYDPNLESQIKFQVRFFFNTYYHDSTVFTLLIDCTTKNKVISVIQNPVQIIFINGPELIFYFPDLTCTYPSCCESFSYQLRQIFDQNQEVTVFGPVLRNEHTTNELQRNYIKLQNEQYGRYQFYIFGETRLGVSGFSDVITLSATFDCLLDEIEITKKLPKTKVAPFFQTDGVPYYFLRFEIESGNTFYELDISDRFTSIDKSIEKRCKFTKFIIQQVKTSFQIIDQYDYSKRVQLSNEGILSLIQFEELYQYDLYISAFNGYKWGNFTLPNSKFLVKISFEPPSVINYAPQFEAQLRIINLKMVAKDEINYLYDHEKVYQYKLPDIKDSNPQDEITVKVESMPNKWMKFDEKELTFEFEILNIPKAGTYKVSIELLDQRGALSTNELVVKVAPSYIPLNISTSSNNTEQQSQNIEIDTTKNLSAKILNIDSQGNMQILFNTTIQDDFNHSVYNNSTLDFEIIPANNRDTYSEFDPEQISFNWTFQKIAGNKMFIKLVFQSPLQISPLIIQDMMVCQIKNSSYFYSLELKKSLHRSSLRFSSFLTKQIPDTESTQNIKQNTVYGQQSLQLMFICTFLLNQVFSGGIIYMLGMLRALQIILHLPITRIIFPGNVSMLFGVLIPCVMYDIVDEEWLGQIFHFDIDGQELLQNKLFGQLQDLGYDSFNAILNLGSVFIFTALYCMRLIFLVAVIFNFYITGKGRKFKKRFHRSLFYGEILTCLLEAYFEFLIAGNLTLKETLFTTSGEIIANYVGYLCLLASFIIMPIVFILVTNRSITELFIPKFQRKWGQVWPLETKLRNHLELFNEACIDIACLHLFVFTDWVDLDNQYIMGWSLFYIIVINIFFNSIFILYYGIRNIYLIIIKYYRITANKITKWKQFWFTPTEIVEIPEIVPIPEVEQPPTQRILEYIKKLDGTLVKQNVYQIKINEENRLNPFAQSKELNIKKAASASPYKRFIPKKVLKNKKQDLTIINEVEENSGEYTHELTNPFKVIKIGDEILDPVLVQAARQAHIDMFNQPKYKNDKYFKFNKHNYFEEAQSHHVNINSDFQKENYVQVEKLEEKIGQRKITIKKQKKKDGKALFQPKINMISDFKVGATPSQNAYMTKIRQLDTKIQEMMDDRDHNAQTEQIRLNNLQLKQMMDDVKTEKELAVKMGNQFIDSLFKKPQGEM